jgi:predicted transcriptional regulator
MTTVLNKQTESLHARIPQGLVKELDRIAASLGRSRNWIFNEAIIQYLEVQQWQTELIEQRLNESEDTNAQFLSHDEIMRRQEKRLKSKLTI